MEQTMLDHPRLRWHRRTGTEGPKHDPYSFEENTFETPRGKATVHTGLGLWIHHNGTPIDLIGQTDEERGAYCQDFIKALTGYTPKQLERIHLKLHSRCRKCGSKETESVRGFPGEHLEVCAKCGEFIDGFFCRSEIE